MTTHKEALRLALEALEDNQHLIADNERHAYVMEYNDIIEKCKEALAQQCVCGEPDSAGTHRTDGPCLAPQPEHEPVAVLFEDGSIVKYEDLEFVPEKSGQRVQMLYTTPPQRKPDHTEDNLEMVEKAGPLFSVAPQRTWVELDDDEMLMIYGQQHEGKKYNLGRMVEAKLKEKNK